MKAVSVWGFLLVASGFVGVVFLFAWMLDYVSERVDNRFHENFKD